MILISWWYLSVQSFSKLIIWSHEQITLFNKVTFCFHLWDFIFHFLFQGFCICYNLSFFFGNKLFLICRLIFFFIIKFENFFPELFGSFCIMCRTFWIMCWLSHFSNSFRSFNPFFIFRHSKDHLISYFYRNFL